MSGLHDPRLEGSLLAAAIQRPALLSTAALPPEVFAGAPTAALAAALRGHVEDSADPMAIELLLREDHGAAVDRCFEALDGLHRMPGGFEVGAARLRRLSAARTLHSRLGVALGHVEALDLEQASALLGVVLDGVAVAEGAPSMSFGEATQSYLTAIVQAEADRVAEKGETRRRHRTGLDPLDHAIGALKPGSLWVVGGRSGCRKSTVILRAAMVGIRDGLDPHIISVEDPKAVWGERIAAEVAAARNMPEPPPGTMTAETMAAAGIAAKLDGRIHFPLDGTPAAVLDCARKAIKMGATSVALDYVQACDLGVAVERSDKATVGIARALRSICRPTGAVAIVGSQIKTAEGKEHKEPHGTAMRESRELFDAADVLTVTWKPDVARDGLVQGRLAKLKWNPAGCAFTLNVSHGVVSGARAGHVVDAVEQEQSERKIKF